MELAHQMLRGEDGDAWVHLTISRHRCSGHSALGWTLQHVSQDGTLKLRARFPSKQRAHAEVLLLAPSAVVDIVRVVVPRFIQFRISSSLYWRPFHVCFIGGEFQETVHTDTLSGKRELGEHSDASPTTAGTEG